MPEPALTTNSAFSQQRLKNLTGDDMQRVNQVIVDNLASDVVLINQLSQHIILSGGKRLRPMLVILANLLCHSRWVLQVHRPGWQQQNLSVLRRTGAPLHV